MMALFYGGMHLCDVRISDKSHDVILLFILRSTIISGCSAGCFA